jgi:glycosyltransferase involved in cell wall biosynthesis
MLVHPRICFVMPRNLSFSPDNATSIDLCVAELVENSRHRASTIVLCDKIENPFPGFHLAFIHSARRVNYLVRSWRITRQLNEIKPDLIVVEQHLPTAFALTCLMNIPVVLHTHNFPKPPSHNFIARKYKGFLYSRLSGVMFVSDACRDVFASYYGNLIPSAVVPNGQPLKQRIGNRYVDQEETFSTISKCCEKGVCNTAPGQDKNETHYLPFCTCTESAARCQYSNRPVKDQIILVVGRCAEEKGILEAALAAIEILKKYPDWKFRFILSELDKHPRYTEKVLQALRDVTGVDILVNIPHKEVLAHYSRSAIALIPSKWKEPFGRTALEGHFARCGVISSGTGGLREISGPYALYIDPNCPTAICEAVNSLISEPQKLAALATQGQKRAEEAFSITSVAQKMDSFLAARLTAR